MLLKIFQPLLRLILERGNLKMFKIIIRIEMKKLEVHL